jgi:outer membrane immunogenic protein
MKKFLLSTAAVLLAAGSASAADLAARPYTKAPAYVAPVYNWTGFYIGGFVGGAFGDSSSISDALIPFLTGTRDSSFFGGGQLGYNYQFAPNWVAGLEGDIGGLSKNERTFLIAPGVGLHDRTNWLASVTGRLGYTWGPGLIYAKGGVAFRDSSDLTGFGGFPSLPAHRDDTGYTVGGGLEYMFAPAWSAKIEYQYYNFGNVAPEFAPGVAVFHYRDDVHTVKAGINYHFNWGGPIVAKY